jgi:lipopolysaccharide export system permease protein
VIISRYLAREVIGALFAVTFILLLAFLCQQVVRYLNYAAIGKIPTNVLLTLVSFEIPYLLAILLPLGLYLGILLAYGRLYADNEMAILKLVGYPHRRIFKVTCTLGLIISFIVLALMLWVNPWISTKRQALMSSDEAALHLVQTLIPGRFQVSPDGNHVMLVEKLSRDHQRAENIFLAQKKKTSDENSRPAWMLVLADEGYQIEDTHSSDQLFVMMNGYRYEGMPGENDYKIIQFKRYTIRMPQTDMHATHQENETLSFTELWNDYANPKRAGELQWRFSIALSPLLLALLALPLSLLRPKQGRYTMLLPAILLYIIYIQLLFIARHWVDQGNIPISIGMWWVHGMFLLGIVILMFFKREN